MRVAQVAHQASVARKFLIVREPPYIAIDRGITSKQGYHKLTAILCVTIFFVFSINVSR